MKATIRQRGEFGAKASPSFYINVEIPSAAAPLINKTCTLAGIPAVAVDGHGSVLMLESTPSRDQIATMRSLIPGSTAEVVA